MGYWWPCTAAFRNCDYPARLADTLVDAVWGTAVWTVAIVMAALAFADFQTTVRAGLAVVLVDVLLRTAIANIGRIHLLSLRALFYDLLLAVLALAEFCIHWTMLGHLAEGVDWKSVSSIATYLCLLVMTGARLLAAAYVSVRTCTALVVWAFCLPGH